MNANRLSLSTRLQYNAWQVFDHKIGRDKAFKWFCKSRKRLESTIAKEYSGRREGRLLSILEVNYENKEQIGSLIKKNIPFIIRGLAKNWPCVQNWNLEYFKNLHGDDDIVLIDNSDRKNNKVEAITLKDVIDNINNEGKKYYRFYPLLKRHPEHIRDFDFNWLQSNSDKGISKVDAFQVFIGGDKTETDLHCGFSSNFFIQAFGSKRWIMCHQEHTPVVDPFPSKNITRSGNGYLGTPFSFFNPDYETYPAFKHVDYYDVTINAGDVMYVPPFLYHNVKNVGKSIGIGYRWLSYKSSFIGSPLFTILDLTKINPTFWKSVDMVINDLNKVHMNDFGLKEDYERQLIDKMKQTNDA